MSELETQDAPSMEDTLKATLEDIQSRGIELEDSPDETQADVEAPSRARDVSGKFAKTEAVGDETETPIGDEVADSKVEEQPVARKAPSSWRKEAQEKFATLDPLLQEEIEKREQDFHKGLEPLKVKAQMADTIERIIQPFEHNMKAANATAVDAIQYFFALDNTFRHGTQVQKAQIVQQLMERAGLTPETLQNAPALDPQLTAAQVQNQQLQSQLNQIVGQQQQQEAAQLNSEIAKFSNGKEHFETVRQDMAALLQAGRAQNLDDAYEKAIWANPQVRSALLAKQQEEARAEANKKAQDAKRSAQVNIPRRGSLAPSSSQTGSMEDTIRENAKRLGII